MIRSSAGANAVANVPPEVELATVRQMMQTLFSKVEALQQNQAIQMAGVHDRLDAVELELPLIQEQGALRMRDMEARMSAEIDQATHSLAARMETQQTELSQLREAKKQTETRLSQAVLDIERLCGTLAQRQEERDHRPFVEPLSPYRSRISEHIRKAALELAPNGHNVPPHSPAARERQFAPSTPTIEKAVPARPPMAPLPVSQPAPNPPAPAAAMAAQAPIPDARPGPAGNSIPDFDSWKRQFMENGDAAIPGRAPEVESGSATVICPRCNSDRTRPAASNRWDPLYRLAKLSPHRCRSCSHRFYKRVGTATPGPGAEPAGQRESEAMEMR
jgi:hypothetical protein